MKKITLFFLLLSALFSVQKTFAQDNGKEIPKVSSEQLRGTFLVEFLKTDNTKLISMTDEVCQKIAAQRNESKITYLSLSETCRIKIFPKKDLSSLKLKDEYIIVESFQ